MSATTRDVPTLAYGCVPRPALPPGPFLIAGLGRAGDAAVRALVREVGAANVVAWDAVNGREQRRRQRQLAAVGVRVLLGRPPDKREVKHVRTIVKSPGMAREASIIQRGLAHDRVVIDELELGWRLSTAPVVAVTGTNGKSTIAGLVHAALDAAGLRAELVGNTQFGPALSGAGAADWLVCEVSSYQLEFCDRLLPEVAVFTNLTPEHLGRHGTLEHYGAIKRRLFVRGASAVSRAVVDVDDDFGRRLANELDDLGAHVLRVGTTRAADYRIVAVRWSLRRCWLRLATPLGVTELETSLPGAYNARNVAAALAAADHIGIERGTARSAIAACGGPPGRLEHIDVGQPFDVIVDFAHNPDGLDQLLRTIRAAEPRRPLTVVFGLAARPGTGLRELGRLARVHSDRLVLTTSGYLGLPPVPALQELLHGARTGGGGEPVVIVDRRRAIAHALRSARPGEIVVIPGRGALPDLVIDPRGVAIPFDDREVVRAILTELAGNRGSRTTAARTLRLRPSRSAPDRGREGPLATRAAPSTSAA